MITIIDYGIGNLRSMEKAIEHVGVEVIRTDDPADIREANRLILPGVGAFGSCIGEIEKRGLIEPIRASAKRGVPFLGVCVGMQLLFEIGKERGTYAGLGLLPGSVLHLRETCNGVAPHDFEDLSIPHMGWNTVDVKRQHPLLDDLPKKPHFYFVHSYRACPTEQRDVLGITTYGVRFPSIVHRNNLFGVQFHPEKSQRAGLQLLRNFAQLPA